MTHASEDNPYQPPTPDRVRQNSQQLLPSQFAALAEIDGIELNGRTKYRVSPDQIFAFWQTGNADKLDESFLIPDVVRSPLAAWQGLERQGTAESICIAGNPDGSFAAENHLDFFITRQPGRVFLVFATPDLLISKWRWTDADSDGSGLPTSHNTRFGSQIWPR